MHPAGFSLAGLVWWHIMANIIHCLSLLACRLLTKATKDGSCNPVKLCVSPKCKFYKLSEFSSLKSRRMWFGCQGKPGLLLQTISVIYSGHCSDFLSIHVIVCYNQSFMCIRKSLLRWEQTCISFINETWLYFRNMSRGKNVFLENKKITVTIWHPATEAFCTITVICQKNLRIFKTAFATGLSLGWDCYVMSTSKNQQAAIRNGDKNMPALTTNPRGGEEQLSQRSWKSKSHIFHHCIFWLFSSNSCIPIFIISLFMQASYVL